MVNNNRAGAPDLERDSSIKQKWLEKLYSEVCTSKLTWMFQLLLVVSQWYTMCAFYCDF